MADQEEINASVPQEEIEGEAATTTVAVDEGEVAPPTNDEATTAAPEVTAPNEEEGEAEAGSGEGAATATTPPEATDGGADNTTEQQQEEEQEQQGDDVGAESAPPPAKDETAEPGQQADGQQDDGGQQVDGDTGASQDPGVGTESVPVTTHELTEAEAPTDQDQGQQGIESSQQAVSGDENQEGGQQETGAEAAAEGHPDEAGAEAILAEMGNAEATLSVRFSVQPEGFYMVQNFPPNAPAMVMYHRLEKHLRVDRNNIRLYWDGRRLTEMDRISDVCILPDDGLPLVIEAEFDVTPPHLRILAQNEQATRSIEVEVHYGDDIPSKRFFVTLVKKFDRKPFLGGYKNTKSQAVYHHCSTQTMVEREIRTNMVGKLSRMTQTFGVTRSTQTRRECGTQMPRSDLVVDETFDRVVVAKPYFSAEKLIGLQTQKAIQLQAYVRGWRARKIAGKLRDERDEEELSLLRENERRQIEHMDKKQREIDRRTHPRTKQDFAVLYNELEAWRLQEVARIKSADVPEAEKKVAMSELLKKETKLLQTIDRLQIQATKENRTRRIETTLNKMSSAKSWGTQSAVNVETPFTIRARELRDLYNALQLTGLSVDERLDILLHVKWTVKELSCPLSREIVELVDREADLLNRGRKEGSLAPLRQRMSNLFLQFIETPEFNPEAIQYQRVPLEYSSRPLVRLDKKQR